jgi:hypothetical protein
LAVSAESRGSLDAGDVAVAGVVEPGCSDTNQVWETAKVINECDRSVAASEDDGGIAAAVVGSQCAPGGVEGGLVLDDEDGTAIAQPSDPQRTDRWVVRENVGFKFSPTPTADQRMAAASDEFPNPCGCCKTASI